jgi:hypothetical protein
MDALDVGIRELRDYWITSQIKYEGAQVITQRPLVVYEDAASSIYVQILDRCFSCVVQRCYIHPHLTHYFKTIF